MISSSHKANRYMDTRLYHFRRLKHYVFMVLLWWKNGWDLSDTNERIMI